MDESIGLLFIILIVVFPLIAYFVYEYIKYKNSSYYKLTQNSYYFTNNNAGTYGEYSIYKKLQYLENNGAKFLFNLYIPTQNGKTTEIDVLLICSLGVFVFESKNFSGWIFGDERQDKWTQTLPAAYGEVRKEHFFNPIMQNEYHIKHLHKILKPDINIFSVIVFPDKCTLKKVRVTKQNVFVIYSSNLENLISSLSNKYNSELLSCKQQDEIYNILFPYSQVSDFTKFRHLINLKPKK